MLPVATARQNRPPERHAQGLHARSECPKYPRQASGFLVAQHATLQSNWALVRGDRNQLMAPLLEIGSQLSELAWKILMNKQQPHAQIR